MAPIFCDTEDRMQLDEIEFRGQGGLPLFGRHYQPKASRPRATVLVTHGLGEHSARYWHLAERLNAEGLEVFSHDLRGHGRSGGRRGDASGFNAFLDDLEAVARSVLERRRATGPLFLFGHSMGGLIVLRFMEQRRVAEIRGGIAASPWLGLSFEPSRKKLLLASLARWIAPGFRQITGMNSARLSRDRAFLDTMPDLHLSHHFLSARLFYDIRRACAMTLEQAVQFNTPLLLLHGEADPVTNPRTTEAFYQRIRSGDKSLRLYPEMLHELHNEINREVVLNDLTRWLSERI